MPRFAIPALAAAAMLASGCQQWWWGDVPYLPTPEPVVEKMLQMARVGPGDVVYDLGSGDGRIVVAAVRDFNATKAVGVEIDSSLIYQSERNAEAAGVADRTIFVQQDIFKMDFSEASVLTMFLLTEINLKLRPRILSTLKPGTRVVSHRFDMGDWEPDETARIDMRGVYLWIVPAQVDGTWRWTAGGRAFRTEFSQHYQKVTGEVQSGTDGTAGAIEDGVLRGDRLRFTGHVPQAGRTVAMQFDGRVEGGQIVGTLTVDGRASPAKATRAR